MDGGRWWVGRIGALTRESLSKAHQFCQHGPPCLRVQAQGIIRVLQNVAPGAGQLAGDGHAVLWDIRVHVPVNLGQKQAMAMGQSARSVHRRGAFGCRVVGCSTYG